MKRRSVLAIGATVAVAGCTDILESSTPVDESISEGGGASFSGSEGETVRLTATTEEVDDEFEGEDLLFQLALGGGEVVFIEPVENGHFSREQTLEEDGTYNVAITGGTAHVVVERID